MKKFLIIIIIIVASYGIYSLFTAGQTVEEGAKLHSEAEKVLSEGASQLTAADIMMKNASLEQFEGTNNGQQVKMLIGTIEKNNENNMFPTLIEYELYINGEKTEYSQNVIQNKSHYDVSFEYGDDGYITKAIIKSN